MDLAFEDSRDGSGGVAKRLAQKMHVRGILVRRWGGSIIDFIALILVIAPGLVIGDQLESTWIELMGLVMGLAYFPVTEGLWGRSAGKFVTGTIVVNENGDLPGVWRVIIRTLLRFVEVNPVLAGGLPAGIVVLATKHKQRLGDLVAGTYVVLVRDLEQARLKNPIHDVFD